jgi:hypothetical protein
MCVSFVLKGIELQGEQASAIGKAVDDVVSVEQECDVVALQFLVFYEYLTATAAGGDGVLAEGSPGVGGYGEHLYGALGVLGVGVEEGDSLGADG